MAFDDGSWPGVFARRWWSTGSCSRADFVWACIRHSATPPTEGVGAESVNCLSSRRELIPSFRNTPRRW